MVCESFHTSDLLWAYILVSITLCFKKKNQLWFEKKFFLSEDGYETSWEKEENPDYPAFSPFFPPPFQKRFSIYGWLVIA